MWLPFKNKHKLNILKSGESAGMSVPIPRGAAGAEIVMQYNDEFGNEYETRVTFDFKNKKIIKQEQKVVKKVKDLPEGDAPNLVIDEKSINWPDINILT